MTELHVSIRDIERPPRIARLRVDAKGWPVPWFVADVEGIPDHRCVDARKVPIAFKEHRCWICGEKLGKHLAFLLGPMCTVSRSVSEGPAHKDCAEYAVKACPFMARPHAHRREAGKPEEATAAAGIPIQRNPGAVCLWVTRSYTPFLAQGGNGGVLFEVGDPTETQWYCEGRPATRDEVLASLESGLPLLREQAETQGQGAPAALDRAVIQATRYLPAA